MTKQTAGRFKKGDSVWLVGISQWNDFNASVHPVHVTLSSLGKQQGTGITTDGRNLRHRIYSDSAVMFETFREVLEYAHPVAMEAAERQIERQRTCEHSWEENWLHQASPLGRQRHTEAVLRLSEASPSYVIWFDSFADMQRAAQETRCMSIGHDLLPLREAPETSAAERCGLAA